VRIRCSETTFKRSILFRNEVVSHGQVVLLSLPQPLITLRRPNVGQMLAFSASKIAGHRSSYLTTSIIGIVLAGASKTGASTDCQRS